MAASNNDQQDPKQPRQPKDLKGLLKFCVEATKSEDAPRPTSDELAQSFTQERKEWLQEALKSMTVSPVERMNLCIVAIEEAEIDTEEGTDQQITALEELQDWVEDINVAGDFIKIKGMRIVPILLNSEVSELRWRCMELIGNLVQNNPIAQDVILSIQLLPAMLLLVDTDPNPTVRVKTLYALSCLARSNEKAQAQLVQADGISVLKRALESGEEKLRVKATFMITAMADSNPALKDTLLDKGVLQQLIKLLKEEHCPVHEHFMSALLTLVTDHQPSRDAALQEEHDLLSFLVARTKALEGKEEFQEEREYAQQLLKTLHERTSERTSNSYHSMAVMAV